MGVSSSQNALPRYDTMRTTPHPPANGNSVSSWISEGQGNIGGESFSGESTPLLFEPPSPAVSQKFLEVEMVRDEIEDNRRKVLEIEVFKILKMSAPVIFAYMLQNSLQTGSILVVGRMVCFLFTMGQISRIS
jgi:hypothetical protein